MITYPYLNLNNTILYALQNAFAIIKYKKEKPYNSLLILTTINIHKPLNVLLADDDRDDKDLFIEAVSEFNKQIKVATVKDGEELMNTLINAIQLPDIIFLDLNMPNKNGEQCLIEIRMNELLKNIPVIIYSTSSSAADIEVTYKNGATLYIKKPSTYNDLKKVTEKFFSLNITELIAKPKIERFVFA
ncbi:MAG: response regulator [Bacteroidia bacterium]